tara:strand:+ start:473 stop:892 length:420 start_codon:yes stop_codon:yes gene_type:complete
MSKEVDEWGLETFTQVGSKIGEPYITITKRKTLSLSSGFLHHAKKQMANCDYVIMRFSKKKNAIVLDFKDDSALQGAVKITLKTGQTSNCSIAAISFFNYFMIDIQEIIGRHKAKLQCVPELGEKWVVYLEKTKGGVNE